MDRKEFEALRNLPDKAVRGDVRFTKSRQTSPFLIAEIAIESSAGQDLRILLRYNPETGSKTINVTAVGVGPICRLEVGGPEHPGAGRDHKHSLQTERCPDRNLPDGVAPRPELAGRPFREIFAAFCAQAGITHHGMLQAPDEDLAS